jgi:hypothetical protein
MESQAATVEEYLASLPEERRRAIQAVRKVILDNLDPGYREAMQYGMIGYCVPHSIYPAGYHCDPRQPLPFAGLASQKNHMALYLMGLYGHQPLADEFRRAWEKTGKRLDMGKSCIRFKRVEDLALDVIGDTIRQLTVDKYVAQYEKALAMMGKGGASRQAGAGRAKPAAARRKAPAKRPAAAARKSKGKAGRAAGGRGRR